MSSDLYDMETANDARDALENQTAKQNLLIGSFGPYMNFAVSDNFLFTFSNLQRQVSGRWSTHNAICSKSESEYIGWELSSMTFDILLSAAHGVNPRYMLDILEYEVQSGAVEMLVIGGRRVGIGNECYYKITKMSEAWNTVYRNGALYECSITLTVEEY